MKKKVFRFSYLDYEVLKKHLLAAGDNESQLFALCSKSEGPEGITLICNKLIIPGPNDLKNQSGASIEPSQEHQAIVYGLGYELRLSIVDIHTHPFSKNPRFSSTDDYHGTKNAGYITEHFPSEVTMGMVVFGNDLNCFEARIWNRGNTCFEPVDRLEILGSPTKILCNGIVEAIPEQDPYARHRIIPNWEQGLIEKLKVFACGLGGTGALMWQCLVNLGVGTYGWLKACDPDLLESSNLPRIPYAFPKNIGKSKAEIARHYARRKAPGINSSCYQESIASDNMQQIAKEANIIIMAADNDGARKIGNNISIRYAIPLVNLASEIIPDESSYEAVGQVQLVIPGQTGCLMCSGAIDASQAVLDLLPEEAQAERMAAGYVRGTDETPTPSVLHLNGVTSHVAISQFLRLVFGDGLKGKEFVHYDRQHCSLVVASVPPNPDCPVCGTKGYLAAGDERLKPELDLQGNDGVSLMLSNGDVVDEIGNKDLDLRKKPTPRSSQT